MPEFRKLPAPEYKAGGKEPLGYSNPVRSYDISLGAGSPYLLGNGIYPTNNCGKCKGY